MKSIVTSLLLIQSHVFSEAFHQNVQKVEHYKPPNTVLSIRIPALSSSNNEDDEFDFGAFKRGKDITENLPEKASFGLEAVPELQRPANEYLDLVRSPLFAWASSDKGLLIRLAAVYVVIFGLVSYPIAGATFTQEGYLYQKLAAANVGTLGLVLVLLVRLYSGWGYVGARLSSNVIEYEESGWYDGATETKTKSERARDLFLYQNDVKPVVDRVKTFSIVAAGLWVASCVVLNTATSAKPIFNEYDPDMLKQLQGDEKLADYAAKQAQGRPTYCNNRYYRAIANGGQGC